MTDTINKQANFNRVEFWAATTIFVFLVFFHITNALSNDWTKYYIHGQVPFAYHFICVLIRYTSLYLAFLVLNFSIVPRLIKGEEVVKNIILVFCVYTAIALMFGITNTYLQNYLFHEYPSKKDTYDFIFRNSFLYAAWLLLVFGFYSIIKYVGLYLLTNAENITSRYRIVTKGGLAAFIIWMITLFILIIADAHRFIITGWGILGPTGILLYWYSLKRLIPKSLAKKRSFLVYMGKTIFWLAVSYLPLSLLTLLFVHLEDAAFGISFFNVMVQLFLTAPLSWILFKYQMRGNEELYVLKKELGQSNANFDFLRSQINPHFLFNALNTIYGTAIQEKAERTSEGIEKLGDMMRFMLQENMQEKIALTREIDYLNNYISLQKLRTDTNPNIKIETAIEPSIHSGQISPMLLIPFVENAFKHGISFREPSHIKVTMELKNKTLYFDVHNSKHAKQGNDPEKNKSGIGLNNVKQRLQLLYPGKHELIIRETGKEFFVHLTIQLS